VSQLPLRLKFRAYEGHPDSGEAYMTDEPQKDKRWRSKYPALGVALGAGIGTALGVATGDLEVWLAVGIGVGVAVGVVLSRRGGGASGV
jgi:hypothetical protein